MVELQKHEQQQQEVQVADEGDKDSNLSELDQKLLKDVESDQDFSDDQNNEDEAN